MSDERLQELIAAAIRERAPELAAVIAAHLSEREMPDYIGEHSERDECHYRLVLLIGDMFTPSGLLHDLPPHLAVATRDIVHRNIGPNDPPHTAIHKVVAGWRRRGLIRRALDGVREARPQRSAELDAFIGRWGSVLGE